MRVVDKRYAFRLQQFALHLGSPEGKALAKAPVFEEHAMAGRIAVKAGGRVGAQGEANIARRLRAAHQLGDVTIGCHLSDRNLSDDAENLVGKLSHSPKYSVKNQLSNNAN